MKDTVLNALKAAGVDTNLTIKIRDNYNQGLYDRFVPISISGIPSIDGKRILDLRDSISFISDAEETVERIAAIDPAIQLSDYCSRNGETLVFDRENIEKLGRRLYGVVSYGILNGGSATSYGDRTKNLALNADLFSQYEDIFNRIAPDVQGLPKGVTPAFIQPDGSYGPSFIELKMRNLLLGMLQYRQKATIGSTPLYPLFQMTSVYTDRELSKRYLQYRKSEFLRDLIDHTGLDITKPLTAAQPMIAAYTQGRPKEIFTNAHGKKGQVLPLPGGHGQNFMVLRHIYLQLLDQGKRFVYLTNVDNLGSTVDPVEIAILALSGKQAAFEFSFRTPVDVKGGILVLDEQGSLNCADIGPAVSWDQIREAERNGKDILFNCATGIFDLVYLSKNIDRIIENLPMRFSDQEKDAGAYSQAEQITWEVLGLIDDFLVFGVEKYHRFLAAKLLIENFLTSGLDIEHHPIHGKKNTTANLHDIGRKLHRGLTEKLVNNYGLRLKSDIWKPIPVQELLSR